MEGDGRADVDEPGRRPFRRRMLVNTAAVGAGNMWAIVVSLVALPITLRGLGATVFGTWVLISTFSASAGWFSIADGGIGAATTRDMAQRSAVGDDDGARAVAAGALGVYAVFGLVFAALFVVLGRIGLPHLFGTPRHLVADLRFALVVFAAQTLFDQFTQAVEAILDGLQRVDLGRLVDAVRRTLSAVAVAAVAAAGGGLRGVAVASAGAAVAGAALALWYLRRELPGCFRRPHWSDVRGLLAYAKVVAVLQPIGVITRQMDRIIVGAVLGPASVALIEIATQIQTGSAVVLTASSYVAAPASAWVDAQEERGLLRELVLRGTKYSLLLTYPVTVLLMIVTGSLIHVWVGPAYAAAAGLTVLALVDTLVSAPMQVGSNVLVGTGRAPLLLRASLVAVLVNLVASLVLVHQIGAAGAFVGTIVALGLLTPMLVIGVCRAMGIGLGEYLRACLVPPVLACVPAAAIAGATAFALRSHPLLELGVAGVVGVVVYVATVARFVLTGTERAEWRGMVRR